MPRLSGRGFFLVACLANYGFSREEFLELTIHDIRPPQDVPRMEAWLSDFDRGRIRRQEALTQPA